MARFVIERDLPAGLGDADIDAAVRRAVAANATISGVRWIHSHLALDRSKFFCEYEAPDQEAVREAARLAQIPCNRVTAVREVSPGDYTDPAP
jgi:hypothetical protein